MILWTSVLVLVLGAINVLFMFQRPERAKSSPGHGSRSSRSTASADEMAELEPHARHHHKPASATEITVGCQSQTGPSTLPEYIKYARLSGVLCSKPAPGAGPRVTEIKNLSNGFAATVFFLSEREFTTDYISLVSGENRIQVSHRYANGTVETHELVAKRQPAAAAAKKEPKDL